jgi:hypothetical protein
MPFVFLIPKIVFLTEVSCLELVLNADSNKKKHNYAANATS